MALSRGKVRKLLVQIIPRMAKMKNNFYKRLYGEDTCAKKHYYCDNCAKRIRRDDKNKGKTLARNYNKHLVQREICEYETT